MYLKTDFCRRPRRFRLLGFALLLTIFPFAHRSVYGQPPVLTNNPDSVLTESLRRLGGAPIRLVDAQNLALKNSTTVREAAAALRAAGGSVRKERGAFDPEVFAEAIKSGTDMPSASPFSGASVLESEETRTATGVRLKLPLGTQLEASVNSVKSETNSSFSTLNPQYLTEGKLQIVQPLLNGFGPGTSGDLTSSHRERDAAEARYEEAVLTTAATVEQTYWDLYAAERDLAVQLLIREQAQSFLSETKLRATAGLVGPNQVANARVFLAEQEQAALDREENLDQISDQLATLIGERPQSASLRYHPQDEPVIKISAPQVDSLLGNAMQVNRSLLAAANAVAAAKARERSARWNALPKLDLVGSIGGYGLAGSGRDVVVNGDTVRSSFSGGGGDAYTSAIQRDNPTWSIGVRLSYPIGLRSGGGERDRLAGERARAEEQYLAARRALEEDVRRAVRELSHAQRRLEVARDGVDASMEQVRIGTLEYNVGRTTAFELVRLAADLAAAQQRYSQALVRAAKAAAEIKRLTSGTIAGNRAE